MKIIESSVLLTVQTNNLFILKETRDVPKVPKDLLLAELLKKHGSMIWSYHDHDSLLENQVLYITVL